VYVYFITCLRSELREYELIARVGEFKMFDHILSSYSTSKKGVGREDCLEYIESIKNEYNN